MAIAKVDFHSQSLKRTVSFNILMPNDTSEDTKKAGGHYRRAAKTLYLLNGYSGCSTDWLIYGTAYDIAKRYNLNIVLPSGENSFYLDAKGTGRAFGEYIGKELVDYTRQVFGLSSAREDTFIGGLSMGGFGALHNALKYNKTFGKAIALSPALIIHEIEGMKEGETNRVADYDYYHTIFGDLNSLENSESNPEFLIKSLLKAGEEIPGLYIACGTEDFLIELNRMFKSFLDEQGVPVEYVEDAGTHDWNYWNGHLEPAVKWLLS